MLVYQFKCFCEDSNTEMTSRQFGKWIKEHIPINIEGVFKTGNKKTNLKEPWVLRNNRYCRASSKEP